MTERLTARNWHNLDPWECCGQDDYCQRGCHEAGGCANGCIVPKLYFRLAEYEDAVEKGLVNENNSCQRCRAQMQQICHQLEDFLGMK